METVMRDPSMKTTGAALAGVALCFVGLAAAPAAADPAQIAPAALQPALDLFTDRVVADYAAALVCLKPDSAGLNPAVWSGAKTKLVATLWANGFPAAFVRSVAGRLDGVKPATGSDCTALADVMKAAETEGFESRVVTALEGSGLNVVTEPVSPESWSGIEAAFAAELPAQKRMLDCVAVFVPDMLPVMVHDWDGMLGRIGAHLALAGLDRDAVSKQLSAAEANALWQRVSAGDEAALRQSCAGDKSWSERYLQFGYGGLADAVDKLLPASIANPNP
jgi:hypothetical protein